MAVKKPSRFIQSMRFATGTHRLDLVVLDNTPDVISAYLDGTMATYNPLEVNLFTTPTSRSSGYKVAERLRVDMP